MVQFPEKPVYDMDDLVALLRILRAPGGCPWDREQTHVSNRRNFLEEAYEAAEAFDRDDPAMMCEELGDMLMQVLFNIHIEEDAGRFTTDDVTDHVVRKLIYRHPHVFGSVHVENSDEVLVNWEQLKRAEKGQKTAVDALDDVARSLPPRWRADPGTENRCEAFSCRDTRLIPYGRGTVHETCNRELTSVRDGGKLSGKGCEGDSGRQPAFRDAADGASRGKGLPDVTPEPEGRKRKRE